MVEDLIYKALTGITKLTTLLATHNQRPAIFYQNAPHDRDSLWGVLQYPRMDYTVDWQYNAERKTAGNLAINVWCLNNQAHSPENIEPIIRTGLSELFLTEGTDTFAILWARSDLFEAGGGQEPQVQGVTLSFDLLAFPSLLKGVNDPLEGVSMWFKQFLPTASIIGLDGLPSVLKATDEKPIIYCRLLSDTNVMRNSYAVAWISVTIAIHVFTGSMQFRQVKCREIVHTLALKGEIDLMDGSPMLLKQVTMNTSYDPLRQGQITLSGEYGELYVPVAAPVMNHANVTRKGSEVPTR